ncbi:Electrogenic sodium bicarbonate cotransporter 1 [Dissostichus eleginoides]|uniref:Electrogenic sodium bicarbonate cotransporter 1 n=1 Tax=Dissostichus eleginoides TaxID=100907 RepID=A0AAD9CFK2_DISEL|nr:Electrogenic sodium bicarbonate cotransporter 1 [Dissostichus eleginoides]
MPNPLLLCQDEEEAAGCTSMEVKLPTGGDEDTRLHPDSVLSCRVTAVWRKWMKRKYNSKNSKEPINKALHGLWRRLAPRHLLQAGRPRLETADLHMCRSAAPSVQPRFTCSCSVHRDRCSLDDGELMSSHKRRVLGIFFLEASPSPVDPPASDPGQSLSEGEDHRAGDRASSPGSWNVFRALRRHTAPELRFQLGEESDSDLEELLDEDGEDGGADTD